MMKSTHKVYKKARNFGMQYQKSNNLVPIPDAHAALTSYSYARRFRFSNLHAIVCSVKYFTSFLTFDSKKILRDFENQLDII